jgi:hypothetical protein
MPAPSSSASWPTAASQADQKYAQAVWEIQADDPERMAIREASIRALALLRHLAAALDGDVRLTAGHDLGSVRFDTHAL